MQIARRFRSTRQPKLFKLKPPPTNMAEKIRAIMIVEIAGRPPEHIKQALEAHVGQLEKVKNIRCISQSISAPKKLEAEQEIYTCFAEVEVEAEDFLNLINLVFDFMPSSIEIIEPTELKFNMADATSFINTLSGRLHRYDEIAKIAQIKIQQMAAQIQQAQSQQEPVKKKTTKKKLKKKSGKKKKVK